VGAKGIGYISHRHLTIFMPDLFDQHHLKQEQYQDASHLNARIELHKRFSTNPYGWFRWVIDQFNFIPGFMILEIGCGPGILWLENKGRIHTGWDITLSDFSPGMIQEARKNLHLSQNKFAYEASDGMAIPFPNETFDAVIANHVLYHFPDQEKALAEINRVLKADGCFYATTNGENHQKELSQILSGFPRTKGKYYSSALRPTGFTLESGTAQLTPWFKSIEVRHYPDTLVVTEAEPLMAYILSMIPILDINPNNGEIIDLSLLISQMIDRNGSIVIHKSSGMFVGVKRGVDND
jgi:ubiquinone/menaquinone biosynthesis C-methylase UbiE